LPSPGCVRRSEKPHRPAYPLASPDKAKAKRATEAMLQTNKLDIAKLQAAFNGS